ncbi:AcrR family transcriptional regulator [Salirhabdus euzebyi]|uniref:AcrR family transcriptional regulator n=1 Tax=Salirhabdus euzebyi TaxID=394506 RepID=A0A841Q266_9BACI|nr:TetR/AcrR family transcriptional regulator [Salirhabdus euzebyi]MBB6452703.1 AcrR family transcriptional regulator [Salirhabdus euzebyi]
MKKEKVDRRSMRAENSIKKVLEAAKALFIQHGFKDTTISMIAKHADVGYGTAYTHFPKGKDEIFLTIIEEVIADFYVVANTEYTVNSKEEAFTFIHRNITRLIELSVQHKKMLAVFYESIGISAATKEMWQDISDRFIQRIAQNVVQAMEKNIAHRNDFDEEIVAGVLFYTVENNLWKIILDQTVTPQGVIAHNITEVYTNGLYK